MKNRLAVISRAWNSNLNSWTSAENSSNGSRGRGPRLGLLDEWLFGQPSAASFRIWILGPRSILDSFQKATHPIPYSSTSSQHRRFRVWLGRERGRKSKPRSNARGMFLEEHTKLLRLLVDPCEKGLSRCESGPWNAITTFQAGALEKDSGINCGVVVVNIEVNCWFNILTCCCHTVQLFKDILT